MIYITGTCLYIVSGWWQDLRCMTYCCESQEFTKCNSSVKQNRTPHQWSLFTALSEAWHTHKHTRSLTVMQKTFVLFGFPATYMCCLLRCQVKIECVSGLIPRKENNRKMFSVAPLKKYYKGMIQLVKYNSVLVPLLFSGCLVSPRSQFQNRIM